MPMNSEGEFVPDQAELAEIYRAALDSASYIEASKPDWMSDEDWQRGIKRNRAHLSFVFNAYDLSSFDTSRIETAITG